MHFHYDVGKGMTEGEILELLETFERNEEWFSERYDEFVRKFPGKVIAIRDQKIVSVGKSIEETIKDLTSKGEDINRVYIGTIPPEGMAFIL